MTGIFYRVEKLKNAQILADILVQRDMTIPQAAIELGIDKSRTDRIFNDMLRAKVIREKTQTDSRSAVYTCESEFAMRKFKEARKLELDSIPQHLLDHAESKEAAQASKQVIRRPVSTTVRIPKFAKDLLTYALFPSIRDRWPSDSLSG